MHHKHAAALNSLMPYSSVNTRWGIRLQLLQPGEEVDSAAFDRALLRQPIGGDASIRRAIELESGLPLLVGRSPIGLFLPAA